MRISEQIWPRMVALICTGKEKANVMTASFVMPISFKPKYIAFSIAPQRHSFRSLQKNKEFTFNVCDEKMKEKAEVCGSYSGKDVDKFEIANLTKERAKFVRPPLIKESPISFECKVELSQLFGDHYLIVGKVVNEKIRRKKFKPLLHKTLNEYPKLK